MEAIMHSPEIELREVIITVLFRVAVMFILLSAQKNALPQKRQDG